MRERLGGDDCGRSGVAATSALLLPAAAAAPSLRLCLGEEGTCRLVAARDEVTEYSLSDERSCCCGCCGCGCCCVSAGKCCADPGLDMPPAPLNSAWDVGVDAAELNISCALLLSEEAL